MGIRGRRGGTGRSRSRAKHNQDIVVQGGGNLFSIKEKIPLSTKNKKEMLFDQVQNRGEAHRQRVTWVCVPGLNPRTGTVGGYAKCLSCNTSPA